MPPFGWLLVLVAAFAGTAYALRYARQVQLLDHPNARSNHRLPTPRGGGIAMVAVMAGVLLWFAEVQPGVRPFFLATLVGLVMVGGIGWLDDHGFVSAQRRLAVHLLAAALMALGAWLCGWPGWLVLVILLAVPVLVNIWNFMDGIDGIAALQALAFAAGLSWMGSSAGAGSEMWLALAMVCFGFLPLNFPRARIFMGDVGSGSLGLLVTAAGALFLRGYPPASGGQWVVPAAMLAPFLVDATLTLGRRVLRGERWWEAHSQHAYQVIVRRIQRHWPVSVGYFGLALLGALLAQWSMNRENFMIISFMLLWYTCCAALWIGAQYTNRD